MYFVTDCSEQIPTSMIHQNFGVRTDLDPITTLLVYEQRTSAIL